MSDAPLTDAAFAEYPVLDTQKGGDAITIQAARKIEADLRARLKVAEEALEVYAQGPHPTRKMAPWITPLAARNALASIRKSS